MSRASRTEFSEWKVDGHRLGQYTSGISGCKLG
jgi:hypothetical protein